MSKQPEFKAEDVWTVARALLDDAISLDVEQRGGRNSYNQCRHCRGHQDWQANPNEITHDANCPVLVARDLLAGACVTKAA